MIRIFQCRMDVNRNYSYSLDINTNETHSFIHSVVIYEFQLHSTHGDTYYIGLNGIEFYNENGEQIGLTEQSKIKTNSVE